MYTKILIISKLKIPVLPKKSNLKFCILRKQNMILHNFILLFSTKNKTVRNIKFSHLTIKKKLIII